MTTRSQKRKTVAEIASGDFAAYVVENSQPEISVEISSKSPKIQSDSETDSTHSASTTTPIKSKVTTSVSSRNTERS